MKILALFLCQKCVYQCFPLLSHAATVGSACGIQLSPFSRSSEANPLAMLGCRSGDERTRRDSSSSSGQDSYREKVSSLWDDSFCLSWRWLSEILNLYLPFVILRSSTDLTTLALVVEEAGAIRRGPGTIWPRPDLRRGSCRRKTSSKIWPTLFPTFASTASTPQPATLRRSKMWRICMLWTCEIM